MKYLKTTLIVLICLVIIGTIWYSRSNPISKPLETENALPTAPGLVDEIKVNLPTPTANVTELAKSLEAEQAFENESLSAVDSGVESAQTESQLMEAYSKNYNETEF